MNEEDLATIDEIENYMIPELTLEILDNIEFEGSTTEIADQYSDAYIKIHNFLVEKYEIEERAATVNPLNR